MNTTAKLAQSVVDVSFDDFDAELIDTAKEVVLDGVSNMLAGSREPLAEPLTRYLRNYADGNCTVVGHDFTTRPQDAAYANATFCHSMDFELMWYPPTHPTSPTLAPIFALSQRRTVTGQQALEALVTGFEVQGRLRYCITESVGRPWNQLHPPGVVGPFGAAASAGKLIGLSREQFQMAFGIAGSRVGGLMANTGTHTKSSHCGNCARNGLEAALLAAEGYTASADIFGARHGFNEGYYGDKLDLSLLVDNFGSPYRMVDPGLTVKKYPAQYPTHWSIDAALELARSGSFRPDEIEKVRVDVGADNESAEVDIPTTGLAGKFAVRYTVAAALLDSRVVIDTFRDERLKAPDMQDLIRRIDVVRRPDIKAMDFAHAWSTVSVTTKDGAEYAARVDRPLGIWDNPLPWQLRVDKFRDCAQRACTDSQIADILAQIESFEAINDVGSFVELLGHQPA